MLRRTLATGLGLAAIFHSSVLAAPAPDSHEALLRELIRETTSGAINYDTLTPELGALVRPQAARAQSELVALGALKSVTLTSTNRSGAEIYRTVFENGALDWAFSVNPEGLIDNAAYRPAPTGPS